MTAKKHIAITGGAQGIGAATARLFAERGHSVAIGDIDAELALKTAALIAADTGATVVGVALDVTDSKAFARFLKEAEAELGGLDVLVNNAGIMPTGRFLEDGDTVMIIESMKMEIPVIAETGGTISRLLVEEKAPVSEGQAVAILVV